jgi:hypothetical protein
MDSGVQITGRGPGYHREELQAQQTQGTRSKHNSDAVRKKMIFLLLL